MSSRKKCDVLVADVPWRFGDKLPGASRGAEKNYSTMSVEEAMRFPLPPLADDAILFFWRVSSMVEEAYRVVRAWGFVPKTELVWVKLTPRADELLKKDFILEKGKTRRHLIAELPQHFGMGRYTRAAHETCIVATRGSYKVADRGIRSTFYAPVGEHSAKPQAFFNIVERLVGLTGASSKSRAVELFARKTRANWNTYGDELEQAHP